MGSLKVIKLKRVRKGGGLYQLFIVHLRCYACTKWGKRSPLNRSSSGFPGAWRGSRSHSAKGLFLSRAAFFPKGGGSQEGGEALPGLRIPFQGVEGEVGFGERGWFARMIIPTWFG